MILSSLATITMHKEFVISLMEQNEGETSSAFLFIGGSCEKLVFNIDMDRIVKRIKISESHFLQFESVIGLKLNIGIGQFKTKGHKKFVLKEVVIQPIVVK